MMLRDGVVGLSEQLESFDQIISADIPIGEFPLSVNAHIGKFFKNRFDQMDGFRTKPAGYYQTKLRQSSLDCPHER